MFLTSEELDDIIKLLNKNKVLVEHNLKYRLPPYGFLPYIRKYKLKQVNGSDIHSTDKLIYYYNYIGNKRLT